MNLRSIFITIALLSPIPFLGAADKALEWAVRTTSIDEAREVAAESKATFKGQIGALDGFFLIDFSSSKMGEIQIQGWLDAHENVLWSEQQIPTTMPLPTGFQGSPMDNPLFGEAWHLHNNGQSNGSAGEDINVIPAWDIGMNGRGFMVAVVDTGSQMDHPDLGSNTRFDLAGNYLYVGSSTELDIDETHGTSVSGIIAAADNSIGSVGIAYGAHLVPVRFIGGSLRSDATYASVLNHQLRYVDVYNNSWGPALASGDSVALMGPSTLGKAAIEKGTTDGRGGLGSIYVFSAGNDAEAGGNINYNGWANLRQTIAVGSVGNLGKHSSYSMPGAALLVCAPSSGNRAGISTTTRTTEGNGYTSTFGGTSAAAPMVSGTVALMLQANPQLTWRDVQHILVKTAVRVDPDDADWTRNGTKRPVNHKYGFGRIDAGAAVGLALNWPRVAAESSVSSVQSGARTIPNGTGEALESKAAIKTDLSVEHVEVNLNLDHKYWGELSVKLISPNGTESILAVPHNDALNNYGSWTFTTARNWGESSLGDWTLQILDSTPANIGNLIRWTLTVYGTPANPKANRDPLAGDDAVYSASFPLSIAVLANDTDPDGDAISILSIHQPRHGEARLVDNQRIQYTPRASFRGEDQIGYTITDRRGGTSHGIVRVTNPGPVAMDDIAVAPTGGSADIDVLSNDIDRSGDPIRISEVGPAASGSVAFSTPTTLFYQPNPGFTGRDSFTYTITDDKDGSNQATVTVFTSAVGEHALLFDGSGSHVKIDPTDNLSITGPFTIESRFYMRSNGEYGDPGFGRIIDKNQISLFSNGKGHAIYPDNSLVLAIFGNDQQMATANSPSGSLQTGRWHHVVVTYDGATSVRMWIDGNEVKTSYGVGGLKGGVSDNRMQPVYIGESEKGDRAFDGMIDFVRLWNQARSPQQIFSFQTPFGPSDKTALVGAWEFFEGSKKVIHDASPMANHGFLDGAIWAPKDESFLAEVLSW